MRQKHFVLFLMLTAAMTATVAQTTTDSVSYAQNQPSFLNKDLLPDGSRYLPAPPAFGSDLFVGDIVWYQWGKTLRQTPRGEQAKREADMDVEAILRIFSEPFGMQLSEAGMPELSHLLIRVTKDACLATSKAKRNFQRQRPFLFFQEGTLIPEEEDTHHTPSYPSSHSSAGWALALVLAEINPERSEEILKAGYEYGQSRVIAGYHYQSDIEAARMTGSACVARLHADETFQKQLKKAKKEIEKLRK